MAPGTPYIDKALLDWCTGAASVTRPVGRFVGLASGTPNYSSDSQAPIFRTTASFQAASTIAAAASASASMLAAVSLSCSTVCTVFGWNLYDNTSAGTRLMFGTLTASQTMRTGSNAIFSAASLKISLA